MNLKKGIKALVFLAERENKTLSERQAEINWRNLSKLRRENAIAAYNVYSQKEKVTHSVYSSSYTYSPPPVQNPVISTSMFPSKRYWKDLKFTDYVVERKGEYFTLNKQIIWWNSCEKLEALFCLKNRVAKDSFRMSTKMKELAEIIISGR